MHKSIRVGHLLRKYNPLEWGGTETAVLNLLRGLDDNDIESVVFAPRCEPYPLQDDLYAQNGHQVRRFHAALPVWGITEAERQQQIAVGGNLLSWSAPIMLLLEPDLSIVHTHTLGRLGGIARTVARLRRIPFVVTIHGGYLDLPDKVRTQLVNKARRGLDYGKIAGLLLSSRRVVKDADAVITCNPREAELLREHLPGKLVIEMPHGIPMRDFTVDRRQAARHFLKDITTDKRLIVAIGRIDGVKNQAFLVAQMPRILQHHSDVALVIAGPVTDREHEKKIYQLIEQHHLAPHVHLIGALPFGDPRLIGLYQCAELTVMPSLSETFGLVILEAWSAGIPVLSSRTSGALQVIKDGHNGYLFDIESPQEFHQTIDKMLNDPASSKKMAAAGRKLARDRYDISTVALQFKELYQSLLERRTQ